MREYNVSAAEVVSALRNQNTTAPVGKVRGKLNEESIRLIGRIESPAEFEQAWAVGLKLSVKEAIVEALTI